MGHGIIGLLSGGTIDRFILGFNARIYIINAQYNDFTYPLMNVFGLMLPVLILLIVLLTYKKAIENGFYHIFTYIFSIGIISSLLAWVFLPIISLFDKIPENDDVARFLNNAEIHPLFVSLIALIIFSLLILIAIRKGLLKKVLEYRNRKVVTDSISE
jgi:hypothetical protein